MPFENDRRRRGLRVALVALAVIVSVPLGAEYVLYASASRNPSWCFETGRYVTREQKIANAIAFYDRHDPYVDLNVARDRAAPCCKLDRGGPEDPTLGYLEYRATGSALYVHIPAKLIRPEVTRSHASGVVIVDRCGKPIYYGYHS